MNTEKTDRAIFASGCFWGTEYFFQQEEGVLKTTVGYTGGHTDNQRIMMFVQAKPVMQRPPK